MGFQNPDALYLLILLFPLGYVLWAGSRHNRAIVSSLHGVAPGNLKSIARSFFVTFMIGSLIVIASKPYSRLERTADYLFLVDVSRSMQARKSCSQPSYLDRAKVIMRTVISGIPEGRFGIFAFERLSFPITHMTYDHVYLDTVIENALYDGLIFDRTASRLGNALTTVADKKMNLPGRYGNVKNVILLTDGNLKGNYLQELEGPVKKVMEAGLSIVSVGIGNPDPTPIPIKEDGSCVDKFIVKDGTLITMGLQSNTLEYLSDSTSGRYFGEAELSSLVTYLRENALSDAFVDTEITQRQRNDVSWVFLFIATISFLGYMWIDLNPGYFVNRKKEY